MRRNMVVTFIILLIALLATSIAWANGRGGGWHGGGGHGGHGHGHVHGGVVISGGFLYYPYPRYYWGAPYYPYYSPYYSPYYYSYGYPAYTYSSPPAYVERYPDSGAGNGQSGTGQGSAPAPSQPYYWYYCPDSQTYYPYVQTCQSAWQQVPAQPPNTSR